MIKSRIILDYSSKLLFLRIKIIAYEKLEIQER